MATLLLVDKSFLNQPFYSLRKHFKYLISTDIDECEQSPCDQNCVNSIGSYSCPCIQGFVNNEDDKDACEGNHLYERW